MDTTVFRIGSVLRQAGGIASWPNLARWLTLMAIVQSPRIAFGVSGLDEWLYSHWALAALWTIATAAIWLIGQAAVTDGMFMHLSGLRIELTALLRMLLRARTPLIQLAVAYGIAIELLSLVPYPIETNGDYVFSILIDSAIRGVVYLYFGVTVPVLVIEQTSVLEALKRSLFLTKSHRARMFGLYFLFHLISIVLHMPLTLGIYEGASATPTHIVVRVVISLITTVFWAAIITALYRALRLAREGMDIQDKLGIPNAHIHTPG